VQVHGSRCAAAEDALSLPWLPGATVGTILMLVVAALSAAAPACTCATSCADPAVCLMAWVLWRGVQQ
jgi:hypothetical protein